MEAPVEMPLAVDMDGTLILTDMSVMSAKQSGLSPPFKRTLRHRRERVHEHRRQLMVVAVSGAHGAQIDAYRRVRVGGGRLRSSSMKT